MKKFLFLSLAAGLLGACSTATLININVDGDSFIPVAEKSKTVAVVGAVSTPFNVPEGGFAANLPKLNFLTGVRIKANVGVVITGGGLNTGTLELYIAPSSTANLYDVNNKVPTKNNCTADTTLNGTDPVDLNLEFSSSSTGKCLTAFNLIKSGSFKIGARVVITLNVNGNLTYTINNFDVGVSGYPVQILN